MNRRSLILLLPLAISAKPPQTRLMWFLVPARVNEGKQEPSGIKFYFERPGGSEAEILLSGQRDGEVFHVAGTVATSWDTEDGGFLRFDVGSLDNFKVDLMVIRIGSRSVRLDHPQAGRYYVL